MEKQKCSNCKWFQKYTDADLWDPDDEPYSDEIGYDESYFESLKDNVYRNCLFPRKNDEDDFELKSDDGICENYSIGYPKFLISEIDGVFTSKWQSTFGTDNFSNEACETVKTIVEKVDCIFVPIVREQSRFESFKDFFINNYVPSLKENGYTSDYDKYYLGDDYFRGGVYISNGEIDLRKFLSVGQIYGKSMISIITSNDYSYSELITNNIKLFNCNPKKYGLDNDMTKSICSWFLEISNSKNNFQLF